MSEQDSGRALATLEKRVAELEAREDELLRVEAELRASRERFELAVRGSRDGIWDWDVRSNAVYYSPRFHELLGLAPGDLDGTIEAWEGRIHEADRDAARSALRDALEHGTPYRTQFRLATKRGGDRWFLARGECLRDAGGRPLRIAGSITDITQYREAEEAFRRSQTVYSRLFDTTRDGLMVTAADGEIVDANPALLRLLGYSLEELRQLPRHALTPAEWESRDQRAVAQSMARGYADQYEKEYLRADGTRLPVEIRVWSVRNEDSESIQLFAAVRDLSERKLAEQRIRRLAFFDALTGLPNRQLFQSRLEEAIDVARGAGLLVAVLFIDLDRFKQVNDSLGHTAGDRLLAAVARRFGEAVRREDLIGRPGDGDDGFSVSRLGGDEFTVVLSVEEREHAAAVARRLQQMLREPFRVDYHEVFLAASIGIAMFPDDGEDAETLTRNADTAMYHAKESGRGIHLFYSDSMNVSGLRKLELEASLRRSLEEGGLRVNFQAQIDAASGHVSGCEALLRWDPPDSEPVAPAEFIPIAEETGLIVPLGEWVLRESCRLVRSWEDAGLEPIPLSVNVSARQFRTNAFPELIESVLAETGLAPERLEIEITESVFLVDGEAVTQLFQRVQDLGVKIALDDFGTGYSALNYLRRFPIDRVKIDQSFVRELTSEGPTRALIEAIISMAHSLGMTVIAEGVELPEQAEILRESGCDGLQGYLFGRPMPPEEFERLLRRCGESKG